MRSLIGRISPAMVIACIALGVALSGSSIAATVTHTFNGAKVKKNTLPGNRVKMGTLPGNRIRANTLGGRQINEARLGRVPSAATAATATTAATAATATTAGNATALGSKPASAYRTFATQAIPSGTTVTGAFGVSASFATGATTPTAEIKQTVSLPGVAANDLTDDVVNFAPANAVNDGDAACTGSTTAPTAPPGRVCLYLSASVGVGTQVSGEAIPLLNGSRAGFVVHAMQPNAATGVFGTWAYTAP